MGMRRYLLTVLVVLLFSISFDAAGELTEPREGRLKAASVYYITKFTEWPAAAKNTDAMTVCLLGEDPLNRHIIDTLRGKQLHGKPFRTLSPSPSDDLSVCAVLFIASLRNAECQKIASWVDDKPILTISTDAAYPAIVHIGQRDNKLSLIVDIKAAHRAGLLISSELLRVSTVID
jgi:hypothetical protein